MTAPGYILFLADINDAEGFQKYSESGYASMSGFDIEVLIIDDAPTLLEGQDVGRHIVLLKFESKAKLQEWYDSEGYKIAKPFRQQTCTTHAVLALEGYTG